MKAANRSDGTIYLQRSKSIGGTLMASCVVSRLKELGLAEHVVLVAPSGDNSELIKFHPHISLIIPPGVVTPDFLLDGCYENDPDRRTVHAYKLFLRAAGVEDVANILPSIVLLNKELERARCFLQRYPRPLIFLGLRSINAAERTPPDRVWEQVVRSARRFDGTFFSCGGPGETAIPGTVSLVGNLPLRTYAAAVSLCDLMVTADSCHLHIAQALKRPLVVIGMSTDPSLRALPYADYKSASADLWCQYCSEKCCIYGSSAPACGNLDSSLIVRQIENQLNARFGKFVSALIPVYRPDIARLYRCIDAIKTDVDEIVIGLDGCRSYVMPQLPESCLAVKSDVRLGYAKMMNKLARYASGRYLLMLNDDVVLDSGSVAKLKGAMDEQTAVVGCLLRYPDGRVQHGGMAWSNELDEFVHFDEFAWMPTVHHRCEMDAVTFAAVLVRREAFYDLLGFDEGYDCYWEDCDFCTKARVGGWKVLYEPSATGVHEGSRTTRLLGPVRKDTMCETSKHRYLNKWRGLRASRSLDGGSVLRYGILY